MNLWNVRLSKYFIVCLFSLYSSYTFAFLPPIDCIVKDARGKEVKTVLMTTETYQNFPLAQQSRILLRGHQLLFDMKTIAVGTSNSIYGSLSIINGEKYLYQTEVKPYNTKPIVGNFNLRINATNEIRFEFSCQTYPPKELKQTYSPTLLRNRRVIGIGEMHGGISLSIANQTTILEDIKSENTGPFFIVLEMFRLEDQKFLNQFNENKITSEELMNAVGWDNELGWGWSRYFYRKLLNKVRSLGIKAIAGDTNDRDSEAGSLLLKSDLVDLETMICRAPNCFKSTREDHARDLQMASVGKDLLKNDSKSTVIFYAGSRHIMAIPWYFRENDLDLSRILELHLDYDSDAQPHVWIKKDIQLDAPWETYEIGNSGNLRGGPSEEFLYRSMIKAWQNKLEPKP